MRNINKKEWIVYAGKERNIERWNLIKKYIPFIQGVVPSYNIEKKMAYKNDLSIDEFNDYVSKAIFDQRPCFVGRFGETELKTIVAYCNYYAGFGQDKRREMLINLQNHAGFFPVDLDKGEKFVELMLDSLGNVDVQATWDLNMERFLINHLVPDVSTTKLMNLSPWVKYRYGSLESKPWTAALANKKVLVVHPFSNTIMNQYLQKRESIFNKLYDADDILPSFELYTVKAVQTIVGNKDERFDTWFDALEWMENECKKINFDVAIIGCGAYGYPLAGKIKQMGKVAIHLGGATQILFGILGKRWEDNKELMEKVVNDSWIKPPVEERPANFNKVEGGCYW